MKNIEIKAFGSYIPEKIVTNDLLSNFLDTDDEWISSRTGIKSRHISTKENTSELCTKAAYEILKNANKKPEDIDLIIISTFSPDYLIPSTACIVQANIAAKKAFAFDLSAACSGFIYSLSVAEKFLRCGKYNNALVIGGEVTSKMLDWSDRSTAVLFGDGAGGVYLEKGDKESFIAENLNSDGTKGMALFAGYMPVKNPFINETEFKDNLLHMDGRAIFNFVVKILPATIKEVCEEANIPLEEIKYIVPHQVNYRIVETVAKSLKVKPEKFYMNIAEYGNTSAASIPIALAEMYQKGIISVGSGDKIILVGFGGGLTWGALLITL